MIPIVVTPSIFAEDPITIGAAVRIIAARGDMTDDKAARLAAGLSSYQWNQRAEDVRRVVRELSQCDSSA